MTTHSVIALGSCSKSAIAIATNTLMFGALRHQFEIVHQPLFPNRIGFRDMKSAIMSSFEAAKALFQLTEDAGLSICVTQELVSRRIGNRRGEIFAVGMVAVCDDAGPLSFTYSNDWVPETKMEQWCKALEEAREELYSGERSENELVKKAADAICDALMEKLVLPETVEFASIN